MAGVKTDKEFYTKYPTEESFMAKYGKKIKAQGGFMTGIQNLFGGGQTVGGREQVQSVIPKEGLTSYGTTGAMEGMIGDSKVMPGKSGSMSDGVGNALKQLGGGNPIDKISGYVKGFKAQKERVNAANQNMQVMGWMEDATMSNREGEQRDIKNARMDAYVRPEDNVINGEELFPIHGVGTNVLAKYGKTMKYQDGGTTPWAAIAQQASGPLLNWGAGKLGAGKDMGSQLGGEIGGAAGSLLGPGGQMAGKFLGSVIGGGLDRSDTRIKRYNKAADRSLNNMIGMNIGDNYHKSFGANVKNGTTVYADGGEIQTYGDGGITPISQNPYGGEMNMINGPSHAEGGVDMNVMGTKLEAEGQEPIYSTTEGDKVIAGNLKVPNHIKRSAEAFIGTKLSGGKFKSVLKSIGEAENKQNSIVDRSVESAEKYTPLRSLDRISLNTLDTNMNIADGKLKKLQVIKDGLSDVQEALNKEENNARMGRKIKRKAQDGKTITSKEKQSYLDDGWLQDEKDPNRLYKDGVDPVHVEGAEGIEGGTETVVNKGIAPIKDTYDGSGGYASNEDWNKFLNSKKGQAYKEKYITGTPDTVSEIETEGIEGFDSFDIPGTPGDELRIQDPVGPKKKGKFDWSNLLNQVPQALRRSDAEDFDSRQLLPEAWAMANNKLEPVQSQKYQPRLRTPYDISLQDQLNQNTAKARSAERIAGNNVGALANLKAQEYLADQNVLGNQFRQNQQFKDQVYSGNLKTLNDADLKNLAIADTQYVRQEQAKSNTKATDFEAIKSMTDKRSKHALENKTLRVWENMYDYRYDDAGRAWYQGAPINVDAMQQVAGSGAGGGGSTQAPAGYEISGYDKYGRPRFVPKGDNSKWRGTPGFNPGASYPPQGKLSKNGSIVKKYKKFK